MALAPNVAAPRAINSNYQTFKGPSVRELVNGYTNEELSAQIDNRLRREAAIDASIARAGTIRPITQQEADASRYQALVREVKHSPEDYRFIEQYEITAAGSNPYNRFLVAMDVAAAFAGGYTPKDTPLSARQSVVPVRQPVNAPNPYGKLGSPAHQAKVNAVYQNIESRGLRAETEYPVRTVNGQKELRYIDVVAIDPKTERVVEVHQVGKTLKSAPKVPVAREREALRDVRHSPELRGAKRIFHTYEGE